MPLQFEPEPTVSPMVSVPPAVETTRYDAAAVEKVIALAQEMQTRHRETFSRDEVEALGAEIGVEPKFVRQALEQIENQVTLLYTDSNSKVGIKRLPRLLTKRERTTATVPAALYLLLSPLTFTQVNGGDAPLAAWFYFVLPAVLAFAVGFRGKSRRVGMLAGSLLGLASILSITGSYIFHHWPLPTFGFLYLFTLGLCFGGAVSGICGASLHGLVPKLRRQKQTGKDF